MPALSLSPGMPRILRSYNADSQDDDINCAIWQAARATLAAPLLFEPVNIGLRGMEELLIDGSFGCNNPINPLLQETCRLFPDHRVSCIISLGSGHLGPFSLPRTNALLPSRLGAAPMSPREMMKFLTDVASDCEGTANDIAVRFINIPNLYFRFSPASAIAFAFDEDMLKAAAISNATFQYLLDNEISDQVTSAVSSLKARIRGLISTQQLCQLTIIYACMPWTH